MSQQKGQVDVALGWCKASEAVMAKRCAHGRYVRGKKKGRCRTSRKSTSRQTSRSRSAKVKYAFAVGERKGKRGIAYCVASPKEAKSRIADNKRSWAKAGAVGSGPTCKAAKRDAQIRLQRAR